MMSASSFAGYTCWTPEHVEEAISVDAVNSSNEIFLATHHPALILRRPMGAVSGGVAVSEDDVLAAFLNAKTKMLLMPVIGQSGTGKSHLIRWLRARIPPDPRRRIIYVPKYDTSLRGVIDLILDHMVGGDAETLKASLATAVDRLTGREAPSALLDALALVMEFESHPGRQQTSELEEERRWLSERLPILFRDAVFRRHLLRDDGVIAGFVSKIMNGTRPGDTGDAFAFTEDDLPLSVQGLGDAGRTARDVYDDLRGSRELRRSAADTMTQSLGRAVNHVFGLSGATTLAGVMQKTREALALANQELVILIEDFTVLQGIQRELLDALIEPPDRDGRQVLCSIRVAMAVTSGYFASLEDTIRTRAGFSSDVYVLDAPYQEEGGWSPDAVASFTARYLNAARLGQEGLARYDGSGELPNACHACEFQPVCHDGFGATVEGYGLYPFNRPALDRAVSAIVGTRHFDPRAVLGQVVRFTLENHRGAIARGEFPSVSFQDAFRRGARDLRQLPVPVLDALETLPDSDRRPTLLTFWGGCPDELINLSPGIHEAFRIRPLHDVSVITPRLPDTPPSITTTELGTELLPASLRANIELLERWANGAESLSQTLNRDIRGALVQAVWDRIELCDHFFSPTDARRQWSFVFDEYSIEIEGSVSRRASSSLVTIRLPRTPTSATVFQGILLAGHHGNWRFPNGPRWYVRYRRWVEEWAQQVITALETWREGEASKPGAVADSLRALAFSARILGISGAATGDVSAIASAALTAAPHDTRPTDLSPRWERIRERLTASRSELIEYLLRVTTGRQGTGAPQVLDIQTVRRVLEPYVDRWAMPSPPEQRHQGSRHIADIVAAVTADLPGAETELATLLARVDVHVIPGAEASTVAAAVLAAAEAAAEVSCLHPPELLEPLRRSCRDFGRFDLSALADMRQLLVTDWSVDPTSALFQLAKLPWALLERTLRFTDEADTVLKNTTNAVESRLQRENISGDNIASEIEATLTRMNILVTTIARSDG